MLPAIVIEKLPRLVRAIKLLPGEATDEEATVLADELAGITAMVAEKFTNDRTAEGIQRAMLLTVGGVSLGLEHLLDTASEHLRDLARLRRAADLLRQLLRHATNGERALL